jgi:thymidylate synthase
MPCPGNLGGSLRYSALFSLRCCWYGCTRSATIADSDWGSTRLEYVPFEQRKPNSQYQDLLRRILQDGEISETRQGPRALTLMQQTMRFELAHGFPLITERSIRSFWRKPIGELCAFINGARTVDELKKFGCDWWHPWVTPEKTEKRGLDPGDIGPGSYGVAFHDFPTLEGPYNQFEHLAEQIRRYSTARTHFITPWIPQYQARVGRKRETTISPCHGWVHIRVINERLHLHMFQRSGDVPVGVPANMVQYAALTLMLEQLTGFAAGVYYHTISDAHIYEDQVDKVRQLVEREPRRLPTINLTEKGRKVTDIQDFTLDHFELCDYDPHPAVSGIPVAP